MKKDTKITLYIAGNKHKNYNKFRHRLKYAVAWETELSSSVPFVLSCTGGTGSCTAAIIKTLEAIYTLVGKYDTPYS